MSEMETSVESELTLKPGRGVLQMCASPDGNTLVVVDNQNVVTVFNVESGDSLQLPVYSSWVTAVGVDPTNQFVVVTYADMMLKEFSLSLRRFTDISRPDLIRSLARLTSTIRHISFDSCCPKRMLLHTDDCFIILEKTGFETGSEEQGKPTKIKRDMHSSDISKNRLCNGIDNTKQPPYFLKKDIIKRDNHVLHFSHVREDSLISVELNLLQALDKLPPVLKVKKFGTG